MTTTAADDTRKKLFEDGDWSLWDAPSSPLVRVQIRHLCEGHWWYVYAVDEACSQCKQVPPAEMIGLKHLHNWDR